jgi:hypothetical protein
VLSGIPSTLYAPLTGGDPLEATRAAGAMIGLPGSIAAAALVHAAVSLFWSFVLWCVLPYRHGMFWALAASAGVAILDLSPRPGVLPLAWVCVGFALERGQTAARPYLSVAK